MLQHTSGARAGPMSAVELVHELPTRLRLRWPALRKPQCDRDRVESTLKAVPGVRRVRVSRYAGSVAITYDGTTAARREILRTMDTLARGSAPSAQALPEEGPSQLGGVLQAAAALALTPVLPPTLRAGVTVLTVAPSLWNGVRTLLRAGLKTEVLDATAVGVSTFRGDLLTANFTHFLLQLGEYLEEQTERRSTGLMRSLIHGEPQGAVWVSRDGQETQVQADELEIGDVVVVGAGSAIPVDGRIMAGSALVNQVTLTGEMVPVRKERGDSALSGTVVQEGQIRIWAENVGAQTTTARIRGIIEYSLGSRPDVQRRTRVLADRLVPLTFAAGGLVGLATRDPERTASVLHADYSCALKLASPVTFRSSMYGAGRHGILVKGGEALERLAGVDTCVFDKTGTLTEGRLEVEQVIPLAGEWRTEDILNLTASAEEHYFHPVAEAVVRAAREGGFDHIDHGEVEFIVAHGISTTIAEGQVHIGSRHFLEDHRAINCSAFDPQLEPLRAQGKTLLYIALGQRLLAAISLRDRLRADARATLARLRRLGVQRLVMLTGDHRSRAEGIAHELGIDEVHGEVVPEEKSGIVEDLKARGARVAFVGDGVNDAPALAAAHLGIGMARGADIARETADIILLEDRLERVADAREIAGQTLRRIDYNFYFTVASNTAILIAASANLLSPITTSLLHNGTTVGLLLSCLRMRNLEVSSGQPALAEGSTPEATT